MTVMRTLAAWRRALLAGTIAISGCADATAEAPPVIAGARSYEERIAIYLANMGGYDYEPMEPVRGAAAFSPWTGQSARTIDPAALATARDYAIASQASAYLVWHEGRIVSQHFAEGIGATTPLVSKSLSKPLSAIAVGRAIALGRIAGLDQPIGEIVPALAGKPKGAITVRQVLDMTAGLLAQKWDTDPNSHWNQAYLSHYHGEYILDQYPLVEEPGARYLYSNAAGDLVAIIVEAATGRRWSEFVGTEVLRKIGAVGGEIWVNRPGGLAHSGCCMLMPAESYLRLGVLLAQDGEWDGQRLLPEGFVQQMATGSAANPNYGLGIWTDKPFREYRSFAGPEVHNGPQTWQSEPWLDPATFMFDGNGNQAVFISPTEQLVILRMGNNPPPQPLWDNAFLPNTLLRALRN